MFARLLMSVFLGILLVASAVEAAALRVAYSAISGAMSSLWVAQEGGYFKREGLEVELLYIGGGSLLIQSMISGDVPFAYGPSVPVINASVRGADLVLIGNTGNSLVFSPPSNFRAAKAGMHELVDVGQLKIVFPNTPVSTTQSFIKGNRDTALRFVRGFSQGLNRLRNDKEFSMKVLSKYTKVTDSETLAQLHQTYGLRYSGDP